MLYYCPDSSFYYDSEDVIKEMLEIWTFLDVLFKVNDFVKRAYTPKKNLQASGSYQALPSNTNPERDVSVKDVQEGEKLDQIGSKLEPSVKKSFANEEADKQSAMLQIGPNLHSQLTRLNVAPSVKDWNSIARFL